MNGSGPLTAGTFLDGDGSGAGSDWLAHALDQHRVAPAALRGVKGLTGAAFHVVADELAAVTRLLLDVDLGTLVVEGWKRYDALTASGQRSLTTPGDELVAFGSHQISWSDQPQVDILVDGVTKATITFNLTVVFDIAEVVAVVRDGNLVALRGGDCRATVTLAIGDQELARRTGHLDLAVVVALTPALPLVDPAQRSALTPAGGRPGKAPRVAPPAAAAQRSGI